jgi:hypothetical protein
VIRSGKRDKACSGGCGDVSNLVDSQSRQPAKMILASKPSVDLGGSPEMISSTTSRLGVGVSLDVRHRRAARSRLVRS